MNWLIFRHYILIYAVIASIPVLTVSAQSGYDDRIERYQSHWKKMIPTHTKIQYAGGIGLISAGVGWDYGKNNQWETDVFLGFLPKYSSKNSKVTFTLKQNFIPWRKYVSQTLSFDPLSCGLYVNTIFNGDFWVSEPDKYPNDYYSFSTKLRFGIFAGQRMTFHIPYDKRFFAKSVTAFYEISSNDLYLVNAFTDSSLGFTDYVKLSFGLKFQLF